MEGVRTERSVDEEFTRKEFGKTKSVRVLHQKQNNRSGLSITKNNEKTGTSSPKQKEKPHYLKNRPKTASISRKKDFSNQFFYEKYVKEFEELQCQIKSEEKKALKEKKEAKEPRKATKTTQSIYDYFSSKHEAKDLEAKFRKNASRVKNYNRACFLKETMGVLKKEEKTKFIMKYYTGDKAAILRSQTQQGLQGRSYKKSRFEQTYEPSSYENFKKAFSEMDLASSAEELVEKVKQLVVLEGSGNLKAGNKLKKIRQKINRIYWENVRVPEYIKQIQLFLERAATPKPVLPQENGIQKSEFWEKKEKLATEKLKKERSPIERRMSLKSIKDKEDKREEITFTAKLPNKTAPEHPKPENVVPPLEEVQVYEVDREVVQKARDNILSLPIKETLSVFWMDDYKKKKIKNEEDLEEGINSLKNLIRQASKAENEIDTERIRQIMDLHLLERRVEYDKLMFARRFSQDILVPCGLDSSQKVMEFMKKNSEYIPSNKETESLKKKMKKKNLNHMRSLSTQGTLLTQHSLGQNYCSRVNPYHARLKVEDSRRKFYEELTNEKIEASTRLHSGQTSQAPSRVTRVASGVPSKMGTRPQSLRGSFNEGVMVSNGDGIPHLGEINLFLDEFDAVAQKVVDSTNRSLASIKRSFSSLNQNLSQLGKQNQTFDKKLSRQIKKDIKHFYNEKQSNYMNF